MLKYKMLVVLVPYAETFSQNMEKKQQQIRLTDRLEKVQCKLHAF